MADFAAKIVISAVDKVTAPVKRITSSFDALKKQATSVSQSFQNVGEHASRFGRQLAVVTTGVVAAGGALFSAVKSAANYGDELVKTSQKAGVSIQALQKLSYAADLADVDSAELATGLKFLNKSIVDALNPASESAKAFASMGISIKDSNGHLKTADQVTLELADKFKNAEDGAKKTATALVLYGRSGTEMIPLLNSGTQAIKDQYTEFERLGHVMTDDQAKASEAFNDNITRLTKAVKGLFNGVGAELIPVVDELVQSWTAWIVENKNVLKQKIKEKIESIVEGVKNFKKWIDETGPKIGRFIENLGGIATIAKVVAGVFAAKMAIGLGQMVVSIGQAGLAITKFMGVTTALSASPFLITVGLIAGAAYLIYKNWDTIKPYFDKVAGWISSAFKAIEPVLGFLLEVFNKYIDYITNKVSGWIEFIADIIGVGKAIFTGLSDTVSSVWKSITDSFQKGVNMIARIMEPISAIVGAPLSLARSLGDSFAGSLKDNTSDLPAPRNATVAAPPLSVINPRLKPAAPVVMQSQKNELKIDMKIDSEGRPKVTSVKSKEPVDFTANVGKVKP